MGTIGAVWKKSISCPPSKILGWLDPICGSPWADCWNWHWPTRHDRWLHWRPHFSGNGCRRNQQPCLMRLHSPPSLWHMLTPAAWNQTNTLGDDGHKKQTRDRSPPWRTEGNPGVANQLLPTSGSPPWEQVCSVVRGHQQNDQEWGVDSKRDQNQHRKPHPPGPGYTLCPSLHELTEGLTLNRQEQTFRKDKVQMPERPIDVPSFPKNRKQWNQPEQHCIQETNSHLQVRLMPGRTGRV